jgi:hypothetical protein
MCTGWPAVYCQACMLQESTFDVYRFRQADASTSQAIPRLNVWVCSLCLSIIGVPTVAPSSCLPHPDDRVHGCQGEHAFKVPSAQILHREAGDKVFRKHLGVTNCYCSSSSSLAGLHGISDFDNTMCDINHSIPRSNVCAFLLTISPSSCSMCKSAQFARLSACS